MSALPTARIEAKPARLTILIDAEKKRAFEALCASQDITVSQVVRQLIREYLVKHGVEAPPAPAAIRDGAAGPAQGANALHSD